MRDPVFAKTWPIPKKPKSGLRNDLVSQLPTVSLSMKLLVQPLPQEQPPRHEKHKCVDYLSLFKYIYILIIQSIVYYIFI